ncbi:MAG: hypothetical protein ACJ76F_08580 [Bacteroidia bacterium]
MIKKLLYLFLFISFHLSPAQSECGPSGYTGKKVNYFYNTMKIERLENYQDGMLHGEVIDYYKNGEVMQKQIFRLGKLIETPVKIDYAKKRKLEDEEYRQAHQYEKKYTPEPVSYARKTNYHSTYNKTTKTGDSCALTTTYDYKNRVIHTSELCTVNRNAIQEQKTWDTLGQLLTESKFRNYVVLHSKEYYPNGNPKSETVLDEKTMLSRTRGWTITHRLMTEIIGYQPLYSGDPTYLTIQKEFDSLSRPIYRREQNQSGSNCIVYNYSGTEKKFFLLSDHGTSYLNGTVPTENYTAGHFENGEAFIDKIVDREGKILLENGKGKFRGFYQFVAPSEFLLPDTIRHPQGVGFTMMIHTTTPGYLGLQNEERFFSSNVAVCSFAHAEGHFKNGKKTGKWHLYNRERNDHTNSDELFYGVGGEMSGRYEDGIHTGEWIYNSGLWKIKLEYGDKGEAQTEIQVKEPDKKLKEDMEAQERYPDHEYSEYSFTPRYMISGRMKNEFPEGEWDCYSSYPKTRMGKFYFSAGRFTGVSEKYFSNGKLSMKNNYKSAGRSRPLFYSPEGDLLPGTDYTHEYLQTENGIAQGKYLKWDAAGKIIQKGAYSDARKNGEWMKVSHHYNYETYDPSNRLQVDSLVIHYQLDTLYGSWFHKTNYLLEKGNYEKGKQDGLWSKTEIRYKDTVNKEEIFDDGKAYLINYFSNGKQLVKNGFGSVRTPSDLSDLVIEDLYENGLAVKSVATYTLSNYVESITYKTPKGDSLAYFQPKEGGTCIKDGTGAKSLLTEDKILYQVHYYRKGRVIRVDYYDRGYFSRSVNFFTSSDSSYNYTTAKEPLITRKMELTDEGLLITIKLSNLKPSWENLNVSLSVGNGVKRFMDTLGFRTIQKINSAYFRYICNEKHESERTLSFYSGSSDPGYDASIGVHVYYFEDRTRHDVDLFNNKSPKGF